MSFCLSFHQGLLGPTGAHWRDDPSDLTCRDSTQQYSTDGCPLSCKQRRIPVGVRRQLLTEPLVAASKLCSLLVEPDGRATSKPGGQEPAADQKAVHRSVFPFATSSQMSA